MKDTFYFSHDYNARLDDKIKLLIRKHGMLGYGVFWSIIEDLYNNANALRLDYTGIAYDLRVDENVIKSVINDFDLFVINDIFFGSASVQSRLEKREEKSQKARESAFKKWGKDANGMPTQSERIDNLSEGNAIKERKGKERKGNIEFKKTPSIEDREKSFYDQIACFAKEYPRDMLRDFYDYWRERTKSGKRMKFEIEATWDLSLRLNKWQRNRDLFQNKPINTLSNQLKSLSDKPLN